ncbi:UDP-N-acetylmuramoyl-L-alanine--D-glutamate ligase [Alkaliphilus hydrothermalis]|uniref:UDP-N-acetylmuramoylalanine--D-glutamate ligase n=1 Tax=Alkaliphilus hydrothermalis TaxID=1482730 RepID=A0ABS2NPS7_9FIRM|nr:UDP-N-acetylmuramoyl-L-alanine--D-glutamate ligase [Alkaliphilus hydrothermalis]MBM7614589.1 UDP-N-acetylmuramoylalanine--D-glutamate ligase [Alkaliphilus hydrothermalis]
MKLKDKVVFVIGLAVTGVPLVKVLSKLGAKIIVNDLKSEEQLVDTLKELEGIEASYILGKHPEDIKQLGGIDLVVASPGVPLDIPFIQYFRDENIEIIGEIELAYRLASAQVVAITGTNGKTTTTALTGEIFKHGGKNTFVVGNIGVAAISKALETTPNDFMVMEVSSFQLESVVEFHPKVAALLNLTPDHLNRHKTMENYLEAKLNIFQNQSSGDYAVVNYDNQTVRDASNRLKAKKIYFSRKEILSEGVFVEDGNIVVLLDGRKERVLAANEIKMPGDHNLENALAATAMAFLVGINVESIAESLRTFGGVEHRTEYVGEVNGVAFINDSKGTNPDASINAVKGIKAPIILLAGGMDKGNDYTEFIEAFNGKVKKMVVYGETAEKIYETAKGLNFHQVTKVKDLEEAVKLAYGVATEGDTILLSPACASWDMYKNFEERGKHFKEIVSNIRRA